MNKKNYHENYEPRRTQSSRRAIINFPLCSPWLYSFGFILLFLLSFSACVRQEGSRAVQGRDETDSKVFIDALGRRYAPAEYPERIVSLNPAITEILFAIGAGERVVGVTRYCDYPPEAGTRTSVGGFSGATVSMEQIHSLEPDLVILSADMHSRIVTLLDELGIQSFAVEPRNFSQVYLTIAVIGEISGCKAGAEEVIASMKEKIFGVEERIRQSERPGVFWVLSEEPLMTAGSESFVSEAIELGGGRNIFGDIKADWPLVSPEQVLIRRPDWIFMGDDIAGTAMFSTPLWQAFPAVREGRTVVLKAGILYRYGPRLADGVAAIAEILHPVIH